MAGPAWRPRSPRTCGPIWVTSYSRRSSRGRSASPTRRATASPLSRTTRHPRARSPTRRPPANSPTVRTASNRLAAYSVLSSRRRALAGGAPSGVGVGRHRLDDALKVVDRGELDGDLALVPAHLHLDPRLEKVGEAVGQVAERRGNGLRAGRPAGRLLRLIPAEENDFLD